MQDDHLLQDIDAAYKHPSENYDWLAENGITSYSQLFAFIKDENGDAPLREKACWTLSRLQKVVDKRRAIPPLLAALVSKDEDVRGTSANTLGILGSRRAVLPLIEILRDLSEPISVRHWAIDGLSMIEDERAIQLFRQIIDDPDEHIEIRSRAIEMFFERPTPVENFILLLSDPTPDIRFWAAYKLSSFSPPAALSALDQVVAFDHTLPIGWGWHVDREAMLPLETIYYRKILGFYDNNPEEEYPWYGQGNVYLISPAPEYGTLQHKYRKIDENCIYTTELIRDIQLSIKPDWLAMKIQRQWPEIHLNVREPRPKSYLLDWHLQIADKHLIGALHRDQYAVVVTSTDNELVYAFAAWYRRLFPAKQALFFYEWADESIEMMPGMSVESLKQTIEGRDESRRNWTTPDTSSNTQTEIN